MAEKYGVVPPKFTKAWWEHFWMYYKWHTIVICFVIIAIVTTIYQKMTEPKFDITMVYAGADYISDESIDNISNLLTPFCEDVNQNGEQLLSFATLNIAEENSDPQYAMAMSMKLQLALSEDESYLFILDESILTQFAGETADECVYRPLSQWLTSSVSEEKIYKMHDTGFAVSIEGNKYFEDAGINTTGKYLAMRFYPREDQKKQIPGYEASVKLANQILS